MRDFVVCSVAILRKRKRRGGIVGTTPIRQWIETVLYRDTYYKAGELLQGTVEKGWRTSQ